MVKSIKKDIARVVVGLPVEGPFDYRVPPALLKSLAKGKRVLVPFGPRTLLGYVVDIASKSPYKVLKSVDVILDETPVIDEPLLKLSRWLSRYYGCSRGEAIEIMLPQRLRKGKLTTQLARDGEKIHPEKEIPQRLLLQSPDDESVWPFLAEKIEQGLKNSQGIIILVPEFSMIELLRERLLKDLQHPFIIFDKKLSPKEELKKWGEAKEGKVRIVIGTRSVVFVPLWAGLIVVFQEDHAAYKQEQSPFYRVRDVVLERSALEHCDVIFVNATPSLELWNQVLLKKIKLVSFKNPASLEKMIVDTSAYRYRKDALLSYPLRARIQKTLEAKGKTILFMNRKGFNTLTRCGKCGFTLACERCDTNLTYLFQQKKMICRYCRQTAEPPSVCPQCHGAYLRFSGIGLEKLESEVARQFPQARLARYEQDNKDLPADYDILLATKSILRFKGRLCVDFLGVIQIDSEFHRPDFRASEKTFSLLTDLSGMAKKSMIIQTRHPDNYALKAFYKNDVKGFYREELRLRKDLTFPPYQHLVSLLMRGTLVNRVAASAEQLFESLQSQKTKGLEIFEPQPDAVAKMRGKYRFQILLKGKSIDELTRTVKKSIKSFKRSGIAISMNVDP